MERFRVLTSVLSFFFLSFSFSYFWQILCRCFSFIFHIFSPILWFPFRLFPFIFYNYFNYNSKIAATTKSVSSLTFIVTSLLGKPYYLCLSAFFKYKFKESKLFIFPIIYQSAIHK